MSMATKTEHITDLMVIQAALIHREGNPCTPFQILQQSTDASPKIVLRAIERAVRHGYVDYGVSANMFFTTGKGEEYAASNQASRL